MQPINQKSMLQQDLLRLLENSPAMCESLCKSFPDVKKTTVSWNLQALIRDGLIKATTGRDKIYGLLKHQLPDKNELNLKKQNQN